MVSGAAWGVANGARRRWGPLVANSPRSSPDGQLVFAGTIAGKKGDVVLRERGRVANGQLTADWVIEPETASGELQGIVGAGSYALDVRSVGATVQGKLEVEF